MKALSIKQPWASLIAHGVKDIENRTWKTNFRGRIYIHASVKGVSDFQFSLAQTIALNDIYTEDFQFMKSAIIGEVDIVDCVINHESIWAEKSLIKPKIEDYKDDEGGNMELFKFNLEIYNNSKPIFNWVLANAVLYNEPILNVKGKLSLWEFEK